MAADYTPTIIAEETTSLQTLTVGGAVMAMDLADRPGHRLPQCRAMAASTSSTAATDGHIGWIDPSRVAKKDAAKSLNERIAGPRAEGVSAAAGRLLELEKKMDLSDLITPDAILPSLKANSKKQAIQAIAEKAAMFTGLPEREIFETLMQREKLGSTGVGGGIAIPHGKLAEARPHRRAVRPAGAADRLRGARRAAGRSGLSAARAGERRRGSPQGARPHRAASPRAGRGGKAPRLARQDGALCGADGRGRLQRGVSLRGQ